jgi:hypothetical protein
MVVSIFIRYVIDANKLQEFEHYGKLWIPLVEKFGGKHHGYFMPSEGANNLARIFHRGRRFANFFCLKTYAFSPIQFVPSKTA